MSAAELASRLHLSGWWTSDRLPQDALACRACGVAVKSPEMVEKMMALGRQVVIAPGVLHLEERESEVNMALCDACSERLEYAGALLDAHPRVAHSLGSRSYALNRIEAVLSALDALGVGLPFVGKLTATDRDLWLILNYLPAAGAGARWSSKFVPIMQHDADPGSCAPSPWAHLNEEQAQELRNSYAALLRVRTDKPHAVAPPDDGVAACLLCGVGTVSVLHSQASSVWGRLWKADPATLGGRGRPEPIRGYLCPACSTAANKIGALGPTALEGALIDYLGVPLPGFGSIQLRGIRAWAALPSGTPPNLTPWAHEPDLDALAEQIRRA